MKWLILPSSNLQEVLEWVFPDRSSFPGTWGLQAPPALCTPQQDVPALLGVCFNSQRYQVAGIWGPWGWGGTHKEEPWKCRPWHGSWSLLGWMVLPPTPPKVGSYPWLLISVVLSHRRLGLPPFCWTTAASGHSLGQTNGLLIWEPCPCCLPGLVLTTYTVDTCFQNMFELFSAKNHHLFLYKCSEKESTV